MMKTVRTLLLLLFVAGIAAAFGKAFIWGESVTKYGAYVPWGLWIGIYIALVGAAAGCVAWGAWLSPQNGNGKGAETSSALLAAAICLAFGLAFVGIDLGKPLQGFRIFLHPAFASPLHRVLQALCRRARPARQIRAGLRQPNGRERPCS